MPIHEARGFGPALVLGSSLAAFLKFTSGGEKLGQQRNWRTSVPLTSSNVYIVSALGAQEGGRSRVRFSERAGSGVASQLTLKFVMNTAWVVEAAASSRVPHTSTLSSCGCASLRCRRPLASLLSSCSALYTGLATCKNFVTLDCEETSSA